MRVARVQTYLKVESNSLTDQSSRTRACLRQSMSQWRSTLPRDNCVLSEKISTPRQLMGVLRSGTEDRTYFVIF